MDKSLELEISENQTLAASEVGVIRLETDNKDEFCVVTIYTTDGRYVLYEVDKTVKRLIPEKMGNWLDVYLVNPKDKQSVTK